MGDRSLVNFKDNWVEEMKKLIDELAPVSKK
jgi:hypothetical protein